MDTRSLILAAVAGAAAAAAVVLAMRTKPDEDKERARIAMQQAELDSKIRSAVQNQAAAIIPTSTAKVFPPIGKATKQVRDVEAF